MVINDDLLCHRKWGNMEIRVSFFGNKVTYLNNKIGEYELSNIAH